MLKKNIFYDLDGTLVNSEEGIFNSVKYVISSFNLPNIPENQLRRFIGPPLHYSFKKYFDFDDVYTDKCVAKYREYYKKKGIFECKLYDGIEDMLTALTDNFNLFVTTSKPIHYANQVIDKFGVRKYFKEIFGTPFDSLAYTKSDVINSAISTYNLDKKDCVLIGDTSFDGEGAKLSEIDFIGVTYGFGTVEELNEYNPSILLKTPYDIIKHFKRD